MTLNLISDDFPYKKGWSGERKKTKAGGDVNKVKDSDTLGGVGEGILKEMEVNRK